MALQLVLFFGSGDGPLEPARKRNTREEERGEEETRLRSWVGNLRCSRCSIPKCNVAIPTNGQSLA